MSPYEQGTGSNVLGGGGSRLPMGGNTDCGQRDSGYLAVSNVSVGGRLDKTGAVAGRCPGDEAVGKPRSQGVCEPALEPWRRGKGLWRKSQDFKPDRGNPAVRHYRGATGNVAMVGMRTRLAIERAGTVTPHLKRGAPVLYPNPRGNREQTDRQNLRSAAPVLDPTTAGFPLSHSLFFSLNTKPTKEDYRQFASLPPSGSFFNEKMLRVCS